MSLSVSRGVDLQVKQRKELSQTNNILFLVIFLCFLHVIQ